MQQIITTVAIIVGIFLSASPILLTYMVLKGEAAKGNKLSPEGMAVYTYGAVATGLGGGTIMGAVVNLMLGQGHAQTVIWIMVLFVLIFIPMFLKAASTQ